MASARLWIGVIVQRSLWPHQIDRKFTERDERKLPDVMLGEPLTVIGCAVELSPEFEVTKRQVVDDANIVD